MAAYDLAVDHLIRFRPEVMEKVSGSALEDPGCVMAGVFVAYLGADVHRGGRRGRSPSRPGPRVRAGIRGTGHGRRPRERAHLAAARRWGRR